MSSSRIAYLLAACVFSVSILASAQQAQSSLPTVNSLPVRDAHAVTALQQAIAAMGGTMPSDSTATGTVTIVAGSETNQGTIRILTRGTQQTLEEVQTPASIRTRVAKPLRRRVAQHLRRF
jgi:hypothetical protein